MGSDDSYTDPEPADSCDTIGICAVCDQWIHDDPPYLRLPNGYFIHRACDRGASPGRQRPMTWRVRQPYVSAFIHRSGLR